MSALLASVRSLDEAVIALRGGADIIDLKEPNAGALGAVPLPVTREVVAFLDGRVPVSATIGDLSGDPQTIARAVKRTADTGVDIVKIGLFVEIERASTLGTLEALARSGIRMVAVLFADRQPNLSVDDIGKAGFYGAMLDTAEKNRGGLCNHLDLMTLRRFVDECRKADLICGLAGSLRLEEIPELLRLGADYLGFRGALCGDGIRSGQLNLERLTALRKLLSADVIPGRLAHNA